MNRKEQNNTRITRIKEQKNSKAEKQKKMKMHEYSNIQQKKWKANNNKDNRKKEVRKIM